MFFFGDQPENLWHPKTESFSVWYSGFKKTKLFKKKQNLFLLHMSQAQGRQLHIVFFGFYLLFIYTHPARIHAWYLDILMHDSNFFYFKEQKINDLFIVPLK